MVLLLSLLLLCVVRLIVGEDKAEDNSRSTGTSPRRPTTDDRDDPKHQFMYAFDGEGTVTVPALASRILCKEALPDKQMRLQMRAKHVVVDVNANHAIACFHFMLVVSCCTCCVSECLLPANILFLFRKLQKLHKLWLAHIMRCSDMVRRVGVYVSRVDRSHSSSSCAALS